MYEQEAIARILAREELSLDDIKSVMRLVRHGQKGNERIKYANTILLDAGDYLPPHWLHALVRADLTEDGASLHLERNRAFFLPTC
jgi:hypothetical protein